MALSLLVIVHEFGHFIAARIFKTRVEKFYMFFNSGFSLVRFKKVGGKWRFKFFSKNVPEKYITHVRENPVTHKKEETYEPIDLTTLPKDDWRTEEEHTEFGIGWIPLGGYCKIAGMIDESMDVGQMSQEPQPWEFRSKPAWQRLIVMIGGVCMNVILAFIIYIGLLSFYGEQYLPTSEVNKYGITVDSLAYDLGLRDGDKILSVDGDYIENFQQIPMEILLDNTKTMEVERDGEKIQIALPDNAVERIIRHQKSFISARMPFEIEKFADKSPAKDAGMQEGDKIIAINDISTPFYQDFVLNIKQFPNEAVNIAVVRDNDTLDYEVSLAEDCTIGVYAKPMLELKTQKYTFWQSVPRGFSKTGREISDYWKQLKLIFNPSTKAYESLGGFIAIGNVFPGTFDWYAFWRMTAFISIILAVMNILPIPALDGGHVLFLLYEIVTRRKPSDKFMEIAQYVGLFIILALVIYANGNDIVKLFR